LTCVICHCWLAPFISVTIISVQFQTIHLLSPPNPKNGHFADLQTAVLYSVQNDINGNWIFSKDLLLYIISWSHIKCHLLSPHMFKYFKVQNKVILALYA
jgi:hypothetical protein